jgi:hypothetical protein
MDPITSGRRGLDKPYASPASPPPAQRRPGLLMHAKGLVHGDLCPDSEKRHCKFTRGELFLYKFRVSHAATGTSLRSGEDEGARNEHFRLRLIIRTGKQRGRTLMHLPSTFHKQAPLIKSTRQSAC